MIFPALKSRLYQALREDRATSDLTVRTFHRHRHQRVRGRVIVQATGVFCGGALARPLLRLLDQTARVRVLRQDGSTVRRGDVVFDIRTHAGALFGAERLLLNLICHMSGIATTTRRYVDAVRGTRAKIMDTRKTTPLWRDVERHAVRCGGGHNHRMSLGDAVLVKDNHLAFLRRLGLSAGELYHPSHLPASVKRRSAFVEMEAKSHRDIWDAIKARVDWIMLDNMPLGSLRKALSFIHAARVALKSAKPFVEVSGGVGVPEARAIARLGVDRISVGALTHSSRILDMSMEVL